ncbi:hypothetical protein [Clavibacter nebraskensis]|uniref:hypothetical protein n=1 Tax=Clavibacter nebraskensis TaxID=31963 RepID=UPI003DA18C2D
MCAAPEGGVATVEVTRPAESYDMVVTVPQTSVYFNAWPRRFAVVVTVPPLVDPVTAPSETAPVSGSPPTA